MQSEFGRDIWKGGCFCHCFENLESERSLFLCFFSVIQYLSCKRSSQELLGLLVADAVVAAGPAPIFLEFDDDEIGWNLMMMRSDGIWLWQDLVEFDDDEMWWNLMMMRFDGIWWWWRVPHRGDTALRGLWVWKAATTVGVTWVRHIKPAPGQ